MNTDQLGHNEQNLELFNNKTLKNGSVLTLYN